MDPTAPTPAQSLQNLSAKGTGRTLHRIIEILENRDNLTHRAMLQLISEVVGQDQPGR
ncbi:hypothetical protein [Arthrobacter sp. UYEF36]|uniref:hypothetical protein n=1 Tax=Arthrobacter sp. UYEF36 TaxID=1756366 RepID=UPI003392A780